MARFEFLLIDPQNDFVLPDGALSVAGALDDMTRLASLLIDIARSRSLGDIHVTLDTHHLLHVANPGFWVDAKMQHPAPFTIISVDDVVKGVWRARFPQLQQRALEYVKALASSGRYPLCIWPPHCLIGHPGHNLCTPICEALDLVEMISPTLPLIDYVTKGSNFLTEHYGAVKAEVVDPGDPSTSLNVDLIEALKNADLIFVAGEALSHCVANTVRDVATNFGEENIKKLVLIDGCSSPVGGFEQLASDFVFEMTSRGMQTKSPDEVRTMFL